jgi:O-methyltransferase involved in polyketide biosynthesis
VPIDFASTRLDEVLTRDRATFFSWLGVVPYLELPAIRDTFRFAAAHPKGSELVFDYGSSPEALTFAGKMVFRALANRVAGAGEPFKTFFDPDELKRLLRGDGFSIVEEFGPADLNRRYFEGRKDKLRIGEMMHMIRCVV